MARVSRLVSGGRPNVELIYSSEPASGRVMIGHTPFREMTDDHHARHHYHSTHPFRRCSEREIRLSPVRQPGCFGTSPTVPSTLHRDARQLGSAVTDALASGREVILFD